MLKFFFDIFKDVFKVYCADHTYTTLKLRMDVPASRIAKLAAEKLGLKVTNNLTLCEVRSNGGSNELSNTYFNLKHNLKINFNIFFSDRIVFKENDVGLTTSLSVNGRLFLSPSEHLDALTPLPEQEGIKY